MLKSACLLAALVCSAASRAIPLSHAPRHGPDSTFNPLVTYPTAGVIWTVGGHFTVSWNPVLPAGVNSSQVVSNADIILGRIDDGYMNLNWTLALDVPLYTGNGTHSVTIPTDLYADPNSNEDQEAVYVIALIGNHSTTSPEFSIFSPPQPRPNWP